LNLFRPSQRKGDDTDDVDDCEDAEAARLLKNSDELKGAVDNLMAHQAAFLVEQVSFGAQKQQFESTPLAMVKSSRESGNVWINFDVNCFGESDHQPERRPCPIGKDKLDIPLRAIFAARHGQEEPKQIQQGDLYGVFSGGKDRKRGVLKSLKTQARSKRENLKAKTYCRNIMLHVSESSWRGRKHRARGHCKLTQAVHVVGCHSTFATLPYAAFKTIQGSNKSDVMGPVDLDPIENLPTMPFAKKKVYLGKRLVLVGGRVESSSGSEGASDDDHLPDEVQPHANQLDDPSGKSAKVNDPPMSYHALPPAVVVNIVEGFNVKHFIDLTPTPMDLAFEILSRGGSYVALCSTPAMAAYLKTRLFNQLVKAVVDPKQLLLHDPRFTSAAAAGLGHFCCIC
jgi:hypothetical protein